MNRVPLFEPLMFGRPMADSDDALGMGRLRTSPGRPGARLFQSAVEFSDPVEPGHE